MSSHVNSTFSTFFLKRNMIHIIAVKNLKFKENILKKEI